METKLEQSPHDKNAYDLFKLTNGITCLLIDDRNSGKEAGMCSCAIAVNAGSFNDPPNRPGLAHFLEHMIFMGSGKYPGENDFTEHLS